MAFSFESGDDDQPMAEINTTPLVDVMLVLLIIFMVTAPLFTHAVKVDLPRASSAPNVEEPGTIALAIDAAGTQYWNGEAIEPEQLHARLALAAAADPQPAVHVHADRDTRYAVVAELLSAVQTAGLTRIGFVTDPSGPKALSSPAAQRAGTASEAPAQAR